jgi:hypothetical protein
MSLKGRKHMLTGHKRTAIAVAFLVMGLASPPSHAGGCDVTVFWDANFRGEAWRTHGDAPYVGDHWNDQISSIHVESGIWEFFFDAGYRGERMVLRPGNVSYVGDHWNDQISSFRCVRPTD